MKKILSLLMITLSVSLCNAAFWTGAGEKIGSYFGYGKKEAGQQQNVQQDSRSTLSDKELEGIIGLVNRKIEYFIETDLVDFFKKTKFDKNIYESIVPSFIKQPLIEAMQDIQKQTENYLKGFNDTALIYLNEIINNALILLQNMPTDKRALENNSQEIKNLNQIPLQNIQKALDGLGSSIPAEKNLVSHAFDGLKETINNKLLPKISIKQ